MNTETFTELVTLVKPFIEKKSTQLREPLGVEEKLASTLRFLATGESLASAGVPVSDIEIGHLHLYSESL